MILYHNPKCSKSRAAKEILERKGIEFKVKDYLLEGLTVDEVRDFSKKLNLNIDKFIRIKEEEYKNNTSGSLSDDHLIELLIKYPNILERPILVNGDRAIIGRPPELVEDII